MNNLYSDLAEVYELMYQTFINYEEEFLFYSKLLESGNCQTVIEIGCGAGQLAPRFAQAGLLYTGLDLSVEMLAIARQKHPELTFLQADMRHFDLKSPKDGAIMTGRTISYLLEGQDVSDCFNAVRENLKKGGLFCFDFIDASRFIPRINETEKITHHANHGERRFFRDSFWKMNLAHAWAFDWRSIYFEEQATGPIKIGEDQSTIRTFTKDEMLLFLNIAGFEVLECLDRPSYAFDTYVMVARSL